MAAEPSPVSVVRQYCRLDAEGARLSSDNPNVEQYFALVKWPDEPGWDGAVVVRNFAVTHSKPGQSRSAVTVRYFVLGDMDGATVTDSKHHTELVTFTLTKSGGTWKIDGPLIPPHISVHAAIASLQSLLRTERSSEQRRQLRAGIGVLKRWMQAETPKTQP
jgi:hypothetical protein